MENNCEIDSKDDLKKSMLTERLQKRDEERLQNLQQRKANKEDTTVYEETGKFFATRFAKAKEDIDSKVSNLGAGEGTSIGEQFDDLIEDLRKLQKFLTDSTRFLSSHEVGKSQSVINHLKLAIEEKRAKVEPKKKFAFKSDKKRATPIVQTKTESESNKENPSSVAPSIAPVECGFSGCSGEVLRMSGEEIDSKDVMLASLAGCRVLLCGAPCTVHMNALRDCIVLCGPTSGSIFIDDCTRCTFVVACHQLRVHRTTATQFYLHVTSRAIIEDCSMVTFAPYNWSYPTLADDFHKATLSQDRNNWNAIDDFNWLASDTPSPNWSVLEVAKRTVSWTEDGLAAE